jgi:hypothetical protein
MRGQRRKRLYRELNEYVNLIAYVSALSDLAAYTLQQHIISRALFSPSKVVVENNSTVAHGKRIRTLG